MVKILLVVAALCIAFAASQAIVCNTECSASGETCTADADANYVCEYNTFCSGGSCAAKLATGSTCSISAYGSCVVGDACTANTTVPTAITYTCEVAPFGPGYPCSANEQCQYQNGSLIASQITHECIDGRCRGRAVGENCSSTLYQCTWGSSCVGAVIYPPADGVCTADPALGETCTTVCQLGSNCAPSNADASASKCITPFSGAEGDFCGTFLDCGDGLLCTGRTYYPVAAAGKCTAPTASSNTDCTQASDCTVAGETCSCNSDGTTTCKSSQGNPDGYGAAYVAYTSCVTNRSVECSLDTFGCSACADQICGILTVGATASLDEDDFCSYSPAAKTIIRGCAPVTVATTAATVTTASATTGEETATTAATVTTASMTTGADSTTGAATTGAATTASTTAATATTKAATTATATTKAASTSTTTAKAATTATAATATTSKPATSTSAGSSVVAVSVVSAIAFFALL